MYVECPIYVNKLQTVLLVKKLTSFLFGKNSGYASFSKSLIFLIRYIYYFLILYVKILIILLHLSNI